MEKFNKTKYDMEYRKKHKKNISIDLNVEEYEERQKLLEKHNMTKVGLLRYAIKQLKNNIQE